MKAIVVLLSAAVLLAACKRRPPVPAAQAVPESAARPTPPPAPATSGTAPPVSGDRNLPALNNAVKAYMAKHKKAPAKLDDLVKEGLIPFIPFATPGSRYELDTVRGEVKEVSSLGK